MPRAYFWMPGAKKAARDYGLGVTERSSRAFAAQSINDAAIFADKVAASAKDPEEDAGANG
eukprot:4425459-Lingulodinium_polyedra.AAC.1